MEVKMEIRYGVSGYDLSVNQCEVLIDSEEIICFRDCDDDTFYSVGEWKFFKTKEEAEQYAAKQKVELKEVCKRVKRDVKRLDELSNSIASRKDFLSNGVLGTVEWTEDLYNYRVLARKYISFGIINVNGKSFEKGKVLNITWGDGCAQIMLDGGFSVTVTKSHELDLLIDIFGGNDTGVFYNINK